jgi:predicted phosphodiesterase
MKERRKAKIAAISCTHAPFTPSATRDWLLNTLADIDGLTHFGHLGDVFEAGAASVHANEHSHALADEYEEASSLLKGIREVLPDDCIRWINTGNHDDNLQAADPRRIPKALREMVHWNSHPEYGDEFRRWAWLPYEKSRKAIMRVGQVHFWHGFDAGMNSDELEGIQMISHGGWMPHALAVRGHTHRPVPPTQAKRTAKIPLPYWYATAADKLKEELQKRLRWWATEFEIDNFTMAGVMLDVLLDLLFLTEEEDDEDDQEDEEEDE